MHDADYNRAAAQSARALAGARCVAMLTGAGVSAESGVPTFRDAQTGLWSRFDPLQLATPTAFSNHPKLAGCGALLRPDVVWFEEMLPPEALAAAEAVARRCDLMLVVGTSAEVYPAAAVPIIAKDSGAVVIEINPNATALSATADYLLRGPAGSVLPALVRQAWPAIAPRQVMPGDRSNPPRT